MVRLLLDELLLPLIVLSVMIAVGLLFVLTPDGDPEKSCDFNDDEWWHQLKQAAHARLILPPDAIERKIELKSSSSFSAKSIKYQGRKLYTKAKRMIYKVDREIYGYNINILVDKIAPDTIPILCFVNTKSGGRYGKYAMTELKSLLNPIQVVDLQNTDPMIPLQLFSRIPGWRVLVCGGDGSVRWVLNCIEKLPQEQRPPVAILPLGTGNDMAR